MNEDCATCGHNAGDHTMPGAECFHADCPCLTYRRPERDRGIGIVAGEARIRWDKMPTQPPPSARPPLLPEVEQAVFRIGYRAGLARAAEIADERERSRAVNLGIAAAIRAEAGK